MDEDPVTAPQHECESNRIPLGADPFNALLAALNAIGRELAQLRQDFQARLAFQQNPRRVKRHNFRQTGLL